MTKLLFLSAAITILGSVGVSALERQTIAVAEFDLAGLNQVVQNHDERLDNQDARLTNVEGDVSDLQTSTNTPPKTNTVYVPGVQTPQPAPQPASTSTPPPAPVLVTNVIQIPLLPSEDIDCKLIYSDGTEKVWRWKTVTYNQGTKITYTSNKCDDSLIGTVKP